MGATLPGVPGVVLGRNDRIAWAFTNTGVDQQDLYLERINPEAADEYQTPEGWARFATRVERIRVKGGDDVELTVRETRHGPVISGLTSVEKGFKQPQFALALRWSALEPRRHDDRCDSRAEQGTQYRPGGASAGAVSDRHAVGVDRGCRRQDRNGRDRTHTDARSSQ